MDCVTKCEVTNSRDWKYDVDLYTSASCVGVRRYVLFIPLDIFLCHRLNKIQIIVSWHKNVEGLWFHWKK